MKCPNCGSENYRATDTMHGPDGNIYRRRKCVDCNRSFRTVETVDDGSEEFKKSYREAYESRRPYLIVRKG